MAKSKWTGEKVSELIEAIRAKDYTAIDDLIVLYGDGEFPDRGYGSGYLKRGPNSVLAVCIMTEDVQLLDHLIALGMPTKSILQSDGGEIPGGRTVSDVLFGSWRGDRNPEILRKIADNGFDFSEITIGLTDANQLRCFIRNNGDDVDLFKSLEAAGLRYWKDRYALDGSDDDYRMKDWDWYDAIPWEDLLCDEQFELVDHFLEIGYKPTKPLRLQIGAVPPRNHNVGPHIKSERTIDYICDHGLETGGLLLSEILDPSEKSVLLSSIDHGLSFFNPEPIFEMLDYEVIELALKCGICELKPESISAAQVEGRQDLLELYRSYGVETNDMTGKLVEELETILLSAEHTDSYVKEEIVNLSRRPKGELETLKALREDAVADWKKVTCLLARLYCAPFAYPSGQNSCRPSSLKKMVGEGTWEETFRNCLERFDGALDIKLLLPMPVISLDSYRDYPKGIGVGFWYEEDLAVYRLLSERGAEFLCKIKRFGGYGEWNSRDIESNRDALPGDAFIWLAPDVSEFVFEKKGWSKDRLRVSYQKRYGSNRQKTHPLGWHLLDFLLLESGNAYAYKWFIEHAADVEAFKKPMIGDVVNTPLLHSFLESKKDASIRTKEAVDLIVKTAKGNYCAETALLVKKLSLSGDAIKQLRGRLSDIKTSDRQPYIDEALAVLDERSSQSKPAKKSVALKLTVPQVITMVADALDEGDCEKIAELEPIAAKVPMADCVELLERAAANCDGEAIDRLFGLFAPFECTASALLVALFSGNVSTAKALVAHGANLDGELLYIDEKRTPKKGKPTREKRYSHGLIGQRYSGGGTKAYNLKDALTKDDGTIVSRTKTKRTWGKEVKAPVNETSRDKATDTLLAISHESGFKKSIAQRLLRNLISFDGRITTDVCFDAPNARKILSAGILSKADIVYLPWEEAILYSYCGSGQADSGGTAEVIRLVRDYAPPELLRKCWRSSFAKRDDRSGEYKQMDTLLLLLDVLDSDNCNNQLQVLTALAETGRLSEIKKLAEKPGWFTKQRIKRLIDAASASNQTEMTAWLLELSSSQLK